MARYSYSYKTDIVKKTMVAKLKELSERYDVLQIVRHGTGYRYADQQLWFSIRLIQSCDGFDDAGCSVNRSSPLGLESG